MCICQRQNKRIGERLKSCPFARRHFAYTLRIDIAFYVCHRRQVFLSCVNYKISLSPHTAAHYCVGYVVHIFDFVTETVSLCFMPRFMSYKCIKICIAQIILCGHRIFFNDILDSLRAVKALGEFKTVAIYIVSESNYINALSFCGTPKSLLFKIL